MVLTPTPIITVMAHLITLIPGDGIGPEVADATVRAVEATGVRIEWERVDAGVHALAENSASCIPDEVFGVPRRHARRPQRPHRHAHRRRPSEHQRRPPQEARPVRQLPPHPPHAGPQDAFPRSPHRSRHLPRKHRGPLLRPRARSGPRRGRKPQDHHPRTPPCRSPRRLRVRPPRRPPQSHRHPQGQHHEDERRPVPEVLPRNRRAISRGQLQRADRG